MSALPHLVWDMGGIMYRYFTEMMIDVGHTNGWPMDQLALGPTGSVDDPAYARMLIGEIGEPEYLDIVRGRLAAAGIDFDPPKDLHWKDQTRPHTWDAIRQIHEAGHRQAVLTNDASKWLGPNWWETWQPASWFDAMVDVVTIGKRKPEPEPYLAAADALGVPPSECLFVDDLPINCEGAEAVGMESHLFTITDPETSVAALLGRLAF